MGGAIAPPWPWQQWLAQWLGMMGVDWSPINAYELTLTLTTDGEIQALNRQYRHLDRPTDVLAFATVDDSLPLGPELLAQDPLYLGDIIISLDTAQRQCHHHGHGLQEEIMWLVAHGFLHLLGWDHPDEAQLQAMWQQQQQLLQGIGWQMPTSAYFRNPGEDLDPEGSG